MPLFHPKTLLDKTYEIGIIIKGIDGTLEIIGGLMLLVISPNTFNNITNFLTQDALQKNPHNFIATHIAHLGHSLATGHNFFATAFLLTHGLVKVVLVACLLLNKIWAYPWALGVLSLFLVYQVYLFVTKPSLSMAFLSVLDVIIIWLIWREWQKVRTEPPAKPPRPVKAAA